MSTFEGLTESQESNLIEKGRMTNAWYNSAKTPIRGDNGKIVAPESIYVNKRNTPTWDENERAFDVALFKRNMQRIKSGKSNDWGAVQEDPFIGDFKKLNDKRIEHIKSAGYGSSTDFSAIDVINVQAQLITTELRDFVLEQAVTEIGVPNLTISIDAWTRFTGQKAIGEGVPPVLKLGSAARTTFNLVKDGTGIGLTFEAQARAVHDIYRTLVDNAVSDLRRIKAASIATTIETATDVAGADWAAYTTDHSTTNPFDNIGTVSDTIVSNNGRPDTLAIHDRVWRDFISNTHVHGFGLGPDHSGEFSTARVVQVPGTNFTAYIDNSKTNTICSVYEKKSIVKFQGPVRTASVQDQLADIDMYRIFDFNLPALLVAGRARDLTGVSA